MAEKSDIVPTERLELRDRLGDKADLSVETNVYLDWTCKPPNQLGDGSIKITMPWPLAATFLREADISDPLNQLRVVCFRIGDTLAYRIVFTSINSERDIMSLAPMAALMLGVEHGGGIRDAIAKERADHPAQ